MDTLDAIENMNSIQLIISLVARFRCEIHQINVKSSFLHGDLSEDIYMEQPLVL